MNNYIELLFNKYINSTKKDRLLYEFESKNEKSIFFSRFCHNSKDILDTTKIVFEGSVEKLLLNISPNINDAYFIISELYHKGIEMNYNEMKEYLSNEYMAIIAISDSLCIIKEENEGKTLSYILK